MVNNLQAARVKLKWIDGVHSVARAHNKRVIMTRIANVASSACAARATKKEINKQSLQVSISALIIAATV